MYKAVRNFKDLQDNKHFYCEGDVFPRAGLKVSEERLKELATNKNASHMVLIEHVEEEKPAELEVKKEKGRKKNARTNIEGN